MSSQDTTRIAYVGPAGAGLGFRLSGMDVIELASGEELIGTLREMKSQGAHGIVFVDEGLAEDYTEELAALNEDALPAMILLPNPAHPRRLAAQKLNDLMVRAVGSDIFNT